ncbi:hypothetical protein BKA69DRAFT_1034705 [Paraphysoderma sedebokerense]|nr:hypothetical protein BKA69DRAFT_1034705 [Paraphysoderma sedebokerense]
MCAPMVRYSKLAFRELVRKYNTDICFTPMILADVFKNSPLARDCEFLTNKYDNPVIIQFAASNANDLADAAEMVAPFVNGIDINCGCPQKWAYQERIGSFLMEKPDLVRDMVRQVRSRTSGSDIVGSHIPCSIKIRIHSDLKETVEFARRAEAVGVEWIAVHGRTRKQKSTEPVDLEAITLVKESVSVPVIANGNIFSLDDAKSSVAATKVDGVMVARGLLENPALFAGHSVTPLSAVSDYLQLAVKYGTHPYIIHHHIMYMLENVMSNWERKRFNILTTVPAIVDFLEEHYGI